MIICSEAYSKSISKFTRSISTLFSDGAAAFVLDHKYIKLISKTSGFIGKTVENLSCNHNQDIIMNGKGVYDFTISNVMPRLFQNVSNHYKSRLLGTSMF